MKPLSFQEKTLNSNLIIEGKIITKKGFINNGRIYTSNTVEIYKILKGQTYSTTINIITSGGKVGNKMERVDPSLKLSKNGVGIFFCKATSIVPNSAIPSFFAYGSAQGHIKYDLYKGTGNDPFNQYNDINTEIYNKIENISGQAALEVKAFNISDHKIQNSGSRSGSAPSISSFSPDTISAGTQSVLTINGSGFGSSQGNGFVAFKNADDGGASTIQPIAWEYKSWSDTKIEVHVNERAGIGVIEVTTNASQTTTSSNDIWVNFARINFEDDSTMVAPDHADDNGTGGYTFRYQTDFNSNTAAVDAFERAMGSWRCGTYVNWDVGSSTSTDVIVRDGINLVRFDNGSELPNNVLGRASSYWSGCFLASDTVWYVDEIDVNFDDGTNWQFGPSLPSASQSDFESVAIHELGHAHQLGHVINNNWIMNYSITSGESIRTLNANSDIPGGEDVIAESVLSNACGPGSIVALNSGNCALGAPIADFTYTSSGLTITFIDNSSGTVDTYSLDFGDGNTGTIPDTTYTYADSGTYIVCLTVTNTAGNDTKCDTIAVTYPSCDVLLTDPLDRATKTGNEFIYAGGWDGLGQRYNGLIGVITDVTFFGSVYPGAGPTNDVAVNIYEEASGKPGTLLGTDTITIDETTVSTSITDIQRDVNFSTPVPVNGNIIITVEPTNNGVDDFYITRNDTLNDGGGLQLALVNQSGTWFNDLLQFGATRYNFDILILPTFKDSSCFGCVISISAITTNISCNGLKDGEINTTATGGTGTLSYSWSNGSTTEDLTGLSAGTYAVTVSDTSGCSNYNSFVITDPSQLVAKIIDSSDVSCFNGSDGSTDAQASGGTGSYSYSWTNGQLTQTISSLTVGSYTVTVRDANSCQSTANVNLSEPTELSISSSTTNPTCNSDCDGSIDITPSGGTQPYTYSWTSGDTTEDISSLCDGSYDIDVTDNNGCSKLANIIITEPTAVSLSINGTDASCGNTDGTAGVTASGGTGGYSYAWNNNSTTDVVSNLGAGSYDVTVADGNGCKAGAGISINEAGAPTATFTTTDISCFGEAVGQIDLTVTAGVQPYSFTWSNGSTSEDISSLSTGIYTVTVSGNDSCKFIESGISITEPTALSISSSTTDNLCNGECNGSIDLTVSGGTMPYSYSWNDGSTIEDISNGCTNPYSVNVTDDNNCVASGNDTINEPSAITILTSSSDASCSGVADGSASSTPSGGTGSFTYNWSNSSTSSSINSLASGTYNVTVTDANNCQSSATETIGNATSISTSILTTNLSCYGGSDGTADVTVSGGTQPYTYRWSNGSTAAQISKLTAGNYTVTVQDANGCTHDASILLTSPSIISLTTGTTNAVFGQSNGTASVTASGGTSPYTYSWSDGQTSATASGLTAGIYTVIVTDSKGCTSATGMSVDEISGLSDTKFAESINVYPNPTSDIINVEFNGQRHNHVTLSNELGEILYFEKNITQSRKTIDMGNFANGVYYLQVENKNGSVVKQIVYIK